MSVRTWITVSIVVVVALGAALLAQLTRPIAAPALVVHASGERLRGGLDEACWPQRSGKLRCTKGPGDDSAQPIPAKGTLRVVFAYPANPKSGSIRVDESRTGRKVLRTGWRRTVRYKVGRGDYVLTAQAGDSRGAYVRYVFRFRVSRSGS